MDAERIQAAILQMIPFLMAIVFHEWGHAIVARRHGDTTAQDLGRLTLNPIPHIDPIGTIFFPLFNMLSGINLMFGWAKPVPINYNRLRPYRRGLLLVSLAGPGANVVLALFCALFLVAFSSLAPPTFYLYEPLRGMAGAAITINYALAVFNLIPLPPLDGSKVIESFLSIPAARRFESFSRFSFFILLGLLWSGALQILSGPILFLSNASVALWVFVLGKLGLAL